MAYLSGMMAALLLGLPAANAFFTMSTPRPSSSASSGGGVVRGDFLKQTAAVGVGVAAVPFAAAAAASECAACALLCRQQQQQSVGVGVRLLSTPLGAFVCWTHHVGYFQC